MRKEKQVVRTFYDTFGWKRGRGGAYGDSTEFVDRRPVLGPYYHRRHLRVRRLIPATGKYFLDAGCGAVPQSLHQDGGWGFEREVCVDFSAVALQEARSHLKERGLYVAADLAHLPFADGTFGGFVSAHVLYHVPIEEQALVVRELHRALAPGGTGVIVDVRPSSPMTRLARSGPRVLAARARRFAARRRQAARSDPTVDQQAPVPELYFAPHEYTWFKSTFPADWNIQILPWSSVDRDFSTAFVPNNALGRALLAFVLGLEERFPRLMTRLGRYPMIVFRKTRA